MQFISLAKFGIAFFIPIINPANPLQERPGSSAGQSTGFLIRGSEVRTLSGAPFKGFSSSLREKQIV